MEKETRQVKRARKRLKVKGTSHLVTHQVYYIPLKRKSRSGVEYEYYRKIIDKIGLKKYNVEST